MGANPYARIRRFIRQGGNCEGDAIGGHVQNGEPGGAR